MLGGGVRVNKIRMQAYVLCTYLSTHFSPTGYLLYTYVLIRLAMLVTTQTIIARHNFITSISTLYNYNIKMYTAFTKVWASYA